MRHAFTHTAAPFVGAEAIGYGPEVATARGPLRARAIVVAPGARIGDVTFAPGVYSPTEIVDRVNRESIVAYADVGPDGTVLVNELPKGIQAERRLARAKRLYAARPSKSAARELERAFEGFAATVPGSPIGRVQVREPRPVASSPAG